MSNILCAMYIRTKVLQNKDGSVRTYLQIVEGVRVNGKVRQRVVCTLGRLEDLQQGQLDRLIEGLARYSQKKWILAQARTAKVGARWSKEWGPALIFRRLWEELGFAGHLRQLLLETKVEFALEEAAFAMVLNRIVEPSSKRATSQWVKGVYDPGFEQLELHHYYRALDFLAEHKEVIEDRWYGRILDLFRLEVDLVFWDTTSTYFEGEGPEGLAEYGHSRDHRPNRRQIVVGVLMTRDGYPVAHEVFPGNTADIATFRVVLEQVKSRFRLGRVVIVADRGMISEALLQAMEQAGMEYIVGVRLRRFRRAEEVLSRPGAYADVSPNLRVKEVWVDGTRYILCVNPEEVERDRQAREAMVAELEEKLRGGLKSLIGNRGYRRYLKVKGGAATIDWEKVEREARYDGKYILRTNTTLPPADVALAYKSLWQVERAFRELKSHLGLRPMFHWTEQRVRGHVLVCFLALILEVVLRKKLEAAGSKARYADLLQDLRQLHAVLIKVDGTTYLARTDLQGAAYDAFKALGMRPPLQVQALTS